LTLVDDVISKGRNMTTDINVNGARSWWDPATLALVALRGIGQVMFQDHAATGLLFLIGIAIDSPLMGVGALIGAITGPVVAALMGFDRKEIEAGLHGFNPVLVGTGLMFFLQPWVLTWVLVIVGCVAATFVCYLARRHLKFPTYTAPFIVTTWLMLSIAHAIAGSAIDVLPSTAAVVTPTGLFQGLLLKGMAEVFFSANIVTGLLFLVGIAISDWRHAAIALLGSAVGTALGAYHNNPAATVSLGIYGYNASLAAMAVYLWRKSLLIPILAAVIAIPLTELFPAELGLPALTAPFVMSAWIVLAIGRLEAVFVEKRTPA
jgi:urea transporter